MFIFASFAQEINFERSQFQNVVATFPEFCLFVLLLWWALVKLALKSQTLIWTNIYTTEIFIFDNTESQF